MRWIQGFINPGTLYLPRPDGPKDYNCIIFTSRDIMRSEYNIPTSCTIRNKRKRRDKSFLRRTWWLLVHSKVTLIRRFWLDEISHYLYVHWSNRNKIHVIYYIMILFKQFYWLSCCHLTLRKIWYCLIKTRIDLVSLSFSNKIHKKNHVNFMTCFSSRYGLFSD
jgi:hypothetical protein